MIFFWILIFLIPIMDCFVKSIINSNIDGIDNINTIIPVLKIVKIKNFGSALGTLKNHPYLILFLTAAILFFLFYMVVARKIKNDMCLLSISFIVGGGLGNLIDRITVGYVVDYIKITFFPPVFNLSDCFICLGTLLLAIYTLKN